MNIYFSNYRISFLVLLFFLGNFQIQAQDEKPKFGKVSMADLQMTRYDKDTAAGAVILSDIGQTYFNYDDSRGFSMIHDRFLRIKILTKEGYDRAYQSISLYRTDEEQEKIMMLKASTFNLENGKIVETKMDNKSVFDEESDIIYKIKKFTLPAVKVGSILDIRYEIESPFFFNLHPWSFQDVIPERYSEYEVRIPEFFAYKAQFSGYYPFIINEREVTYSLRYKETSQRLATRNVPAMRSENYTTSLKNYQTCVEFELDSYKFPTGDFHDISSTWDRIIHRILTDEDFGGQLKRTRIVQDAASSIKATTSAPFDRMTHAYDYIRTNMVWNDRNSIYPTTKLRKAFSESKGNSADINLTLIMLLRELGIKTEPVLLSTRDNGIIYPTTPNKSRLNYVIACAEVDGKKYLLDATDLNRPYSMLPFRCMNGKGILAVDENLQWIDLLNNEKDNTRYFGEFRIGPDGTLEGKLNRIYDGYTACYQRDDLLRKGNDQYIKDLTEKIKDAHVDSIKIENGNIASPLTVSYIIQSQEITQNAGDLIFFNTLLGFGESSNPLAPLHRDYPVDLGCPVKKTFGFVIQIPEGYSVESLPQRSSISLPDRAGMFQYTALQVGDKIAVNCIFNISKTFFVMNEYDELREFFTRAIEKMEEKIVLKKI